MSWAVQKLRRSWPANSRGPGIYLWTLALISISGLLAFLLVLMVPGLTINSIFLPAVLAAAIFWGLWPAMFATLLAIGAGALLAEPIGSFRFTDPQELLDVAVFGLIALMSSHIAAFAREQAIAARLSAETIAGLQRLSRRLADTGERTAIAQAVVDAFAEGGRKVWLFEPKASEGRLVLSAQSADAPKPDASVSAAAEQAWLGDLPVLTGFEFHKLSTSLGDVGLIVRQSPLPPQGPDPLFSALADQAASALERGQIAEAMEDRRVEQRAERLREAVIGSISHDLQTPLASILGAATTLESYGPLVEEKERQSMLATIREEAERLTRSLGNLFDLTQIRAGGLAPKLEWMELADVVDAALRHAGRALRGHKLDVSIPLDLPMLRLDGLMMEHALINLLENAAKYSPPDGPIRIKASHEGQQALVEISDNGIGIASADLDRIFEPFYRAGRSSASGALDPDPPGKGLGLMISRAFVEAQNGALTVASGGPGRGSTFRITLPVPAGAEETMEAL